MKFEAEARPFADTDHMDEVLIERWNSVVGVDDIVFHLGDAVMGDKEAGIARLARCNGRKFLVPGNHDGVFSQESASRQARFRPLYEQVFEILPEQQEIRLADGSDALMCHFPYDGDSHGPNRYAEMRPVDKGQVLIHGHVHSQWRTQGRQYNVGVDVNGLTPVSEDTICDWIQTL